MKKFPASLFVLAAIVAAGCMMDNPHIRHEVARRIAAPSFMVERQIPAGNFILTAFERMHERGEPAHLYIEGTGLPWRAGLATYNPTPANPVGLHLASRDLAENLAWLSRPCQYLMHSQEADCGPEYWASHRFAPEVLESYNQALNEIRARYDITGFHLIGFGDGGTTAALLGAQRNDVLSFRTVAAALDAADEALTSPAAVSRLRGLPQYHFLGGQDEHVPPAALDNYLQAMAGSPCVKYDFIQEAGHEEGWVDKWPELLARPVGCGAALIAEDDYLYEFDDFELPPEPIYTVPEVPVKP